MKKVKKGIDGSNRQAELVDQILSQFKQKMKQLKLELQTDQIDEEEEIQVTYSKQMEKAVENYAGRGRLQEDNRGNRERSRSVEKEQDIHYIIPCNNLINSLSFDDLPKKVLKEINNIASSNECEIVENSSKLRGVTSNVHAFRDELNDYFK